MSNKADHIKIHAGRRIEERLGLSSGHLKKIRQLIQNKQSEFLFHESWLRSQHRVNYNGQVFRAVYDKKRHLIVTVLPDKEV